MKSLPRQKSRPLSSVDSIFPVGLNRILKNHSSNPLLLYASTVRFFGATDDEYVNSPFDALDQRIGSRLRSPDVCYPAELLPYTRGRRNGNLQRPPMVSISQGGAVAYRWGFVNGTTVLPPGKAAQLPTSRGHGVGLSVCKPRPRLRRSSHTPRRPSDCVIRHR